jgi:hypothetical protein
MQIVYAMQPIPKGRILFLAGPTPRSGTSAKSWRPAALDTIREIGFDGAVLVPEDENGVFHGDYCGQVDWETQGLIKANCIMFWVPRALPDMPGLTTNDEFGYWKASGKVVWGSPPDAVKVTYQRDYCGQHQIPCFLTMSSTCRAAVEMAQTQPALGSLKQRLEEAIFERDRWQKRMLKLERRLEAVRAGLSVD